MSNSFFPGMHEYGGIEGELAAERDAADAAQDDEDLSDEAVETDDSSGEAAGVFAPDENAPDDDAMTDDDAVTADNAVSTGETHADDLDRADVTRSRLGPDDDSELGGVAPR